MMSWISIEISLLLVWSPLHGLYFATGLVQRAAPVVGDEGERLRAADHDAEDRA
jgi:hypothetical protein